MISCDKRQIYKKKKMMDIVLLPNMELSLVIVPCIHVVIGVLQWRLDFSISSLIKYLKLKTQIVVWNVDIKLHIWIRDRKFDVMLLLDICMNNWIVSNSLRGRSYIEYQYYTAGYGHWGIFVSAVNKAVLHVYASNSWGSLEDRMKRD